MTNEEWLAARPEITATWEQAYNDFDHLPERYRGFKAMTAVLPAIIAAASPYRARP